MASIDYMFQQLTLDGNSWAMTLGGFVLVLIILFGVIAFFGKNKQKLSGFGIISVVFIGSVLATALGLFEPIVLILILVLSIIFIIIKTLFFGKGGGS